VSYLSSIPFEELKNIPYLNYYHNDGRAIFSQPYFNPADKTFKIYLPQGGKIIWLFAEPVESGYYAESNLNESTDIYISAIDIIARQYFFESLFDDFTSLITDINNCGISIEKYHIFLDLYKNKNDTMCSSLLATELEFFFGNLRSLYDLLQAIINDLWKRATGKKLPDSFNKVVSNINLKEKYALPDPLIKYYDDTRAFFSKCCLIRDNIFHRGLNVKMIFCFEDGFALQKDSVFPSPFKTEFDEIWSQNKIKVNGMVSILALMAYVNKEMLENLNLFAEALIQTMQPLPSISEKCKLFFRSPFAHHLIKSKLYIEEQWVASANK
jgi:hypothetical protein